MTIHASNQHGVRAKGKHTATHSPEEKTSPCYVQKYIKETSKERPQANPSNIVPCSHHQRNVGTRLFSKAHIKEKNITQLWGFSKHQKIYKMVMKSRVSLSIVSHEPAGRLRETEMHPLRHRASIIKLYQMHEQRLRSLPEKTNMLSADVCTCLMVLQSSLKNLINLAQAQC